MMGVGHGVMEVGHGVWHGVMGCRTWGDGM